MDVLCFTGPVGKSMLVGFSVPSIKLGAGILMASLHEQIPAHARGMVTSVQAALQQLLKISCTVPIELGSKQCFSSCHIAIQLEASVGQ